MFKLLGLEKKAPTGKKNKNKFKKKPPMDVAPTRDMRKLRNTIAELGDVCFVKKINELSLSAEAESMANVVESVENAKDPVEKLTGLVDDVGEHCKSLYDAPPCSGGDTIIITLRVGGTSIPIHVCVGCEESANQIFLREGLMPECSKCGDMMFSGLDNAVETTNGRVFCCGECVESIQAFHDALKIGPQCGNIYCGKPGSTSKCGKCMNISYCSRACQVTHWKTHKPYCKKIVEPVNPVN